MKYVGIDLHKKTISIWVVNQERKKLDHKRLYCLPVETLVDYFRTLVGNKKGTQGRSSLRHWQLLKRAASAFLLRVFTKRAKGARGPTRLAATQSGARTPRPKYQ